jgi:hypothetical protein
MPTGPAIKFEGNAYDYLKLIDDTLAEPFGFFLYEIKSPKNNKIPILPSPQSGETRKRIEFYIQNTNYQLILQFI